MRPPRMNGSVLPLLQYVKGGTAEHVNGWSGKMRAIPTAQNWVPGAPPFVFFEGWDSTAVRRVGFLGDSCSALSHREPDDPLTRPFRKVREKDGAPSITVSALSRDTSTVRDRPLNPVTTSRF